MFLKPTPPGDSGLLRDLRDRTARIGRTTPVHATGRLIAVGIETIDRTLPGGGLALGALHEAAGTGPDTEHAGAATLFIAGLLARLPGPILWVVQQSDLFAPGLAGVGLHPDRIVFAEAGKDVLAAMEEGLRHAGLASVVGELTGRLTLVASRRLQLAAEQSGILAVALRRSRMFDDPALNEPSAATTRWRVGVLPSPADLAPADLAPADLAPADLAPVGLARARWQLDLTRCRGGQPGSWIVEACDATGHLALVADLRDGSDQEIRRRAG